MNYTNTEIKTLLDKALLSEEPKKQFEELLPEIRGSKGVDTAWMSGNAISVRFKQGFTQTWIIKPRHPDTQNTHLPSK